MTQQVLFKLNLTNAKVPVRASDGAAGYDLYIADGEYDKRTDTWLIDTGVAMVIPEGMVGKVYIRSGMAAKGARLVNGTGIIDSDYRGNIKLMIQKPPFMAWDIGDRVGQIVFVSLPAIELVATDELPDTKRGVGGFGSTGTS